jgi:hypothetical protein
MLVQPGNRLDHKNTLRTQEKTDTPRDEAEEPLEKNFALQIADPRRAVTIMKYWDFFKQPLLQC